MLSRPEWTDLISSFVTSTYTPHLDEMLLVLTFPGNAVKEKKNSLNADLCPAGRCTCMWNPSGSMKRCFLAPEALHGLCVLQVYMNVFEILFLWGVVTFSSDCTGRN